jgi:hypothetical protein
VRGISSIVVVHLDFLRMFIFFTTIHILGCEFVPDAVGMWIVLLSVADDIKWSVGKAAAPFAVYAASSNATLGFKYSLTAAESEFSFPSQRSPDLFDYLVL